MIYDILLGLVNYKCALHFANIDYKTYLKRQEGKEHLKYLNRHKLMKYISMKYIHNA
jgi:hypothetical protein